MKKGKLSIIILLIVLLLNISLAYSLEVSTHEAINKRIAEGSFNGFSLDTYLKNNLGFTEGKKESVNGQEIWMWVMDGGRYEDKPPWVIPYLRSVNHFHNPLTEEGFSGYFYGLLLSGDSSVVWAQKPIGTQSPISDYILGGNYSWHDTRDYFYRALTYTNKTEREIYFAKTFRGMGQLMHLVEDASVPAHTRNDGHLAGYEKWVDKNVNINATNPIFFDKSILDRPISGLPIANIFDTNQYSGTNPNVTIGNYIGLSEFTNANFFSEDTIFNNYPHPVKENTTAVLVEQYAKDGKLDETWYIQGYTSQRLAAYSYFWDNSGLIPETKWLYHLDDFVYEDYASQLIPRAVGYSAGLLDYFFRGEFYITYLVPSNDGVNPVMWGNQTDTGTDINLVSVLIQNNSKINDIIESIGEGTLTLTVSYKDSTDTTVYVPADNTVSVTSIPVKDSGSYLSAVFTFTDAIEAQTAEDITYYLAFRGQLGNETDAVIGRVIKGPILYNVSPDEGTEGTVITLAGNNLPIINGPFPTTSEDVRFHHDVTKPYTVEVINKTDTDITVTVPNTAGLLKPGYGGLRVRNILDTGEKIYSNPVSFFPIAEGEVKNIGTTTINVTIETISPIVGDYALLPETITINNLLPGASQPIQLTTGFTYRATANTSVTKNIELLTPEPIDFVFEVQ